LLRLMVLLRSFNFLDYPLSYVFVESRVSVFILKIQAVLQSASVLQGLDSVTFNFVADKIILIVVHSYRVLGQAKYVHLLLAYVLHAFPCSWLDVFGSGLLF